MQAYQERVVEEKNELDIKIEKLTTFLKGEAYDKLNPAEQGRMAKQLDIMRSYSDVLGDRIRAFVS